MVSVFHLTNIKRIVQYLRINVEIKIKIKSIQRRIVKKSASDV